MGERETVGEREAMMSQLQQQRAWEGWLSAEIRANYFADLSDMYRRRQRVITWLMLFLSSGAFFSLVAKIPQGLSAVVAPIFALLATGVSLYASVAQHQKSMMETANLHLKWSKLASKYERLWDDVYAEDAQASLKRLEGKSMELSQAGTAFPANRRKLLKWQRYVETRHNIKEHEDSPPRWNIFRRLLGLGGTA